MRNKPRVRTEGDATLASVVVKQESPLTCGTTSQINELIPTPTNSRRSQPSEYLIAWRTGYLAALRWIEPREYKSSVPRGLSPGNTKTGTTGECYKTMLVWNLPAVACCPGASPWCMTHCYNGDERSDVFAVGEWAENWFLVEEQPESLTEYMTQQLALAAGPVAVRIHSSGDFYSERYIAFWKSVIRKSPTVDFWAYTRSWSKPELLPALEDLRKAPNLQLFASWDYTMPRPPASWRLALVVNNQTEVPTTFDTPTKPLSCPEQIEGGPNCASCGFCIRADTRGVAFVLH